MRMFITSENKYISNDMKIFGTCSIPLTRINRNIYFAAVSNTFELHSSYFAMFSGDAPVSLSGMNEVVYS